MQKLENLYRTIQNLSFIIKIHIYDCQYLVRQVISPYFKILTMTNTDITAYHNKFSYSHLSCNNKTFTLTAVILSAANTAIIEKLVTYHLFYYQISYIIK